MGAEAEVSQAPVKKLRVLALHGFRTSGAILQKQLSRWSPSVHELVELTFLDGLFPATGESDVKAIFEGPYFEWMQHNGDWSEYYNYEQSLAYIVDYMEKKGPFVGILGFCQGAILGGCLLACQIKKRVVGGKSPADLPPIRFYISLRASAALRRGTYLNDKGIKDVYSGDPMDVPTLHFIGANDEFNMPSVEYLQFWKYPTELHHRSGHRIEKTSSKVMAFLKRFTSPQS
ncbi:hypothetical protein R1sor_014451 [Riccia sorocarpa]|uniref:Serine hydrolase domain-containing protein n=1 Tax=Riccia sorocarpa TaxID=122646 RepID=A0ABD3H9F2_9MARC